GGGPRATRRCHWIGPHKLVIWRGAKPLLRNNAPHIGHGGQAVGWRARAASTASARCTARTRATCHVASISAVREGASSIARRRRCTDGSSSRMLSRRHSIGTRPPLEPLAGDSKSLPCFCCYASPPPTDPYARKLSLRNYGSGVWRWWLISCVFWDPILPLLFPMNSSG